MPFNLNLQRLEKKWNNTTGESKIIKNTIDFTPWGSTESHTNAFQGITK
jgi:hypothetical protein